jgi:heptosyltransferase-2
VTTTLPTPRTLLVRLPNPVGDAVMATPALRTLRTALPSTRIVWAGGPAASKVLEGLPWRDGVMPLAGPLSQGLLAPWRAARLLRRQEADAILLMPNSFSSALAARLARIPVRVGVPRHGRGLLLTRRVKVPLLGGRIAPRSMRAHYLDLVAPFGAVDDGRGTALATTPYDEERAARRLAAAHLAGRPFLAVNPGASFGPSKVYPPASMGAVAREVRQRTGLGVLVVCGPGEQDLARAVADAAGPPVASLHEEAPDLGELKALLRRARLLLTTDAGPRHVAEAFGVPTVVLVGPTDPLWGSGGPATVVRKEGLPCLACHLHECPIDHPCMRTLEPGEVARTCLQVLSAPVTHG